MMTVAKPVLYNQVTKVTEDYFGPAASRFIDRLIINHLGKEPEQLTNSDLPELIEWTRVTVSVLSDDKKMLKELTNRLQLLSGN